MKEVESAPIAFGFQIYRCVLKSKTDCNVLGIQILSSLLGDAFFQSVYTIDKRKKKPLIGVRNRKCTGS